MLDISEGGGASSSKLCFLNDFLRPIHSFRRLTNSVLSLNRSESDTSDSEETLNVESTVIGEDDEPLRPDLLLEPVRWMKLSDLHVSRKACYITFLHLTL